MEEKPKKSQNALLVKVGMALLFVFLVSAIGFLLWKKSKTSESGSSTPDSVSQIEMDPKDTTIDWKEYRNSKYYYQFKCPGDAKHEINSVSGSGIDKPLYQETCSQADNQVTVQVLSVNAKPIEEDIDPSEGLTGKEFDLPSGTEKVRFVGHNEEFVNQVITTFETTGS